MKNEIKGDWEVKNEMEGNEEQSGGEIQHKMEGKAINEMEWEGRTTMKNKKEMGGEVTNEMGGEVTNEI